MTRLRVTYTYVTEYEANTVAYITPENPDPTPVGMAEHDRAALAEDPFSWPLWNEVDPTISVEVVSA